VVSGPSSEGVPGPTVMVICLSLGNGSTGRKTSQRPSRLRLADWLTVSSALISSAVASRSGKTVFPVVALIVSSTASGLMRWSNATKMSGSRCVGPSCGHAVCTWGGGVVKAKVTASASFPPVAEVVPAGISTV